MISPDIPMRSEVSLPTTTAETQEKNSLKITFNDGSSDTYPKDYLLRLSGIQAILNYNPYLKDLIPACKEFIENHVRLTEYSKDHFDLVLRLLLENEPFYQVVSEDCFDNPYFFEDLQKLLAFFEPENFEETFQDILDDQLIFMPLEIAKRILQSYDTSILCDAPPLAIRIAKQILFDCHFLSEEEAPRHFRELTNLKAEMIVTRNRIKSLEAQLVRTSTGTENSPITNEISRLDENLILMRRLVESLIDKTNPTLFGCMEKQKLAEKVNHPDPELRAIASDAQQSLAAYSSNIYKTLIKNNANMTRKDLLDYIIGPKAYLFDYYNILTTETRTGAENTFCKFYPASNPDKTMFFTLCEDSPEELEKSIRDFFIITHITSPKPLLLRYP